MIAARLGYKEMLRKITVQKFGITENSENSVHNTKGITNTLE